MTAVEDLDEVIEQFHLAQGEFVKGNPEPKLGVLLMTKGHRAS